MNKKLILAVMLVFGAGLQAASSNRKTSCPLQDQYLTHLKRKFAEARNGSVRQKTYALKYSFAKECFSKKPDETESEKYTRLDKINKIDAELFNLGKAQICSNGTRKYSDKRINNILAQFQEEVRLVRDENTWPTWL